MRYPICLLASLFLALAQPVVRADGFVIKGEDITWAQTPGTTLDYLIGIKNPDKNLDLLAVWQLNLAIKPATHETVGDLLFVGSYEPSANYLLEGRNAHFDSTLTEPSNSIAMVGGMDSDLWTGVPVPENGRNLLKLKLQASSDARGIFSVSVTPEETSSFWAGFDAFGNDKVSPFGNLPFESASSITIGTITIQPVPEPASIIILMTGLGLVSIRWLFK